MPLCPVNTAHGDFEKEELGVHIQEHHPELTTMPINHYSDDEPSVEGVAQNQVTKVKEDITHKNISAPPIYTPDTLPFIAPTEVPAVENVPLVPAKLEPIELIYKYTGQCEKCGNHVDTLFIDAPSEAKTKKQFVLAFCMTCKKQLDKRNVLVL